VSFADTCGDDFKIFDSTETVTFTAVREGGSEDTTVRYAEPQDLSATEAARLQGLFGQVDRKWGLGAKLLPGVTPQAGDLITQGDGTVWTLVGNASKDGLSLTWVCPTKKGR
jgi:hypothetical protein